MPTASSLLSAYASLSTSIMLFRTMFNQLFPRELQRYVADAVRFYWKPKSSKLTLVFDEKDGMVANHIYDAAEAFLCTRINPDSERLRITKSVKKALYHKLADSEEIVDSLKNPVYMEESVNLDHPSTFDTLAMDPMMKKAIMDDLDLFLKRRDFYKRLGKAWKRGYLLYGPPGTGKSSLIAAIANYLKFDIFDLQLMNIGGDSSLKKLMLRTSNRSILVIEDIDCSIQLPGRKGITTSTLPDAHYKPVRDPQFSLSGLLNFIDGLWSCCGDERIIIFTTNHKERLDPALLRPGRMDVHIHMSYLTTDGFNTLAANYLNIDHHWRFREIQTLIEIQDGYASGGG
ncbi:AAA+ ATPase domain-containing protein [Tanacetum coccineum]|uniref:AAA+ ATPase domain-containing protein n=1 Tax=Tanacetum coccineum TaxID=301880 RepID=A0ABQ5E3X1_9ASTR